MTARIAIIAALVLSVSDATPVDVVAYSAAVAHIDVLAVDTATLIAVAHVETGGTFRSDLVSRVGACGVMQVLPKWSPLTCDEMSGHLGGVVAGAIAWRYWQARAGRHTTAEHYNGGNNPGFRASVYGREFERRRRKVSRAVGKVGR